MGKPDDNGISFISRKLTGSDLAALRAYGLSGDLFEEEYFCRRLNNNGLSAKSPSLPGHGENLNRLSSIKWKSWHVSTPAHTNKADGKHKNLSADIKDLIPLVRGIAQKIHRSLPANIMLNDLVQDGMIGLLAASTEHDATLGVPFHAYAENKIRWAIMDGLRAADWAGRSVRRRASKVAKTTARLQALLSREPSKKEVADALDVRVDDIASILGDAYGYSFVRIDDGHEGDVHDIPDSRMEPYPIVEQRETYSRAVAGLRILRPNERRALVLRTLCDMSVLQTAAEMGISESRVSQLYKKATEKLVRYI